jgi:hypothetical protein
MQVARRRSAGIFTPAPGIVARTERCGQDQQL